MVSDNDLNDNQNRKDGTDQLKKDRESTIKKLTENQTALLTKCTKLLKQVNEGLSKSEQASNSQGKAYSLSVKEV